MARPKVLVAWELGANLGHVTKIAEVVSHLQGAVDLVLALREPWQLRLVAPSLEAVLLPAPYHPSRTLRPGESSAANFAAMLATEGWDDAQALSGLIEAWRGLFSVVRPDVLLAQAAPTAQLAAFGTGLRVAVLGSGYDNPPLATPMPRFGVDPAAHPALAGAQEAEVFASARRALERSGTEAPDRFCDLLRPDASLLMAWPQTDHYPDRHQIDPAAPPYLGQIFGQDTGQDIPWKDNGGPRIFAYLRPSELADTGFDALCLLGPDHDIICAAPGAPLDRLAALAANGVRAVDGPVRLRPLLTDCDLGLHHMGTGVASALLAQGVPQIGLPKNREQLMLSKVLSAGGLARYVGGPCRAETLASAIVEAIKNKDFRGKVETAAKDIADRYQAAPGLAAAESLGKFFDLETIRFEGGNW